MRIVHGMGLFTGLVVLTTLVSAGCSSAVSGGGDAHQGSPKQAVSSEPGALQAPSKGTSNACVVTEIGDGATCEDLSTFNDQALSACDSAGLLLTHLTFTGGCAGDQASGAVYTCCPDFPVPSPLPDPSTCVPGGTLGDGTTCQDIEALGMPAFDACWSIGLEPNYLDFASGCPEHQSASLSYLCCEKLQPPPPPPACSTTEIGDGHTCQDLSALVALGDTFCTDPGLHFAGVTGSNDCAGGLSTSGYVSCCKPPVAAPSTCSGGQLGDGTTCQDNSAFQTQAEDACLQAGLDFAGVKTTNDCPGGLSTYGYYTCCGSSQP